MFSRSVQYAIKATIDIASKSMDCKRVSLKDVADEINTPVAFTAKIVQSLVRNGLIDSLKGRTGGYCIEPNVLDTLTIGDIVRAIDGPFNVGECALGLKQCSITEPCPIHHKYKEVKERMNDMMDHTLIKDLVTGLLNEDVVLKQ